MEISELVKIEFLPVNHEIKSIMNNKLYKNTELDQLNSPLLKCNGHAYLEDASMYLFIIMIPN